MPQASVHPRPTLVVLILLLANLLVPAAHADVLISELCDPRVNYLTDRYIEIWNSGPASVDLTGWQLTAIGNGAEIFTWNLSGTIAPGEALVAGDVTTVITFPVDFADEAWSNYTTTWNGNVNDGARLRNGSSVVVDELFVPSNNFENATMVRNEGVTAPNVGFVLSEWTSTAVDYPTEATPGTHWDIGGAPPVIGTISIVPASPEAGDPVDVQAVVTDAAATIASVTLNWGTSSGSLTNFISMTNIGGDTYETASPIPGQPGGTTVYYQVTATNDVPAVAESDELLYGVALVATIAEIQGTGDTSPYVGADVTTTGVVTANTGLFWVVQDGTGARSGIWVAGRDYYVTPGTEVTVMGTVTEADGNTVISGGTLFENSFVGMPAAEVVTTGDANLEDWEGVLIRVENATCNYANAEASDWSVFNSGSSVDVTGYAITSLDLGSIYTITGPMNGANGTLRGITPVTAADIVFVSDPAAPSVASVDAPTPTTVYVAFTETVTPVTAEVAANYTIAGYTVTAAAMVAGQDDEVELTVSTMLPGEKYLTIDGVEDLVGNAMDNVQRSFTYYGGNIPEGYYDTAEGKTGEVLQFALHQIIDNHTVISYAAVYDAFYTTDDKPNGKVWDMYSDVPGGTPPYEYTFGVDEGGDASAEGTGYNREHSWPSSWYGGSGTPYTDVFLLYPTDNRVNNMRGNYPYGEVGSVDWTSLNGSKRGYCSYPGYTGMVFEPIDEYKGDFARTYFYFGARYYGEDGSWEGSPQVDGAQLLPWAVDMMLEWHANDPVSAKEIDRNEAAYAIQGNRNPFIDRPDFVLKLYRPEQSPVEDLPISSRGVVLHQNAPNPFNPITTIRYELDAAGAVDLQVFDLSGRLVRTIFTGTQGAGDHEQIWRGRDQAGRPVASGVYFYRLRAGDDVETKRMLLAK